MTVAHFTPEKQVITNAELVKAFHAYADLLQLDMPSRQGRKKACLERTSSESHRQGTGISRRYVMKNGS